MRGESPGRGPSLREALGVLSVLLTLAATPAKAQIPQPDIADIEKRSGLLTRIVPIEPHLPPDLYRDNWYNTRWADRPAGSHPNCIKGGGLYGLPWRSKCTQSVYPYFYGSPGQGTVTPECRRWWRPLRLAQGLVQPFRPVGMYYDQGSYVPIFDLDPLTPGPGPYPIPWFPTCPHGG